MFLAIITILVHTVIPHHHHKDIACFSSSDCHDEYYQHDCTKQEHHSKHCETEGSDDCVLYQMPAIPRNNVGQLITENEHSADFLQDIKFDILTANYVNIIFSNINYFDFSFESKYTFLINSSSGLRAPPLV
jgi:hypothetical protein